jgi:hypothetical protein
MVAVAPAVVATAALEETIAQADSTLRVSRSAQMPPLDLGTVERALKIINPNIDRPLCL